MADKIDPESYWNDRYNVVDVTRSGHIDLPAEYNDWLYRRKHDHVAKALRQVGGSLRGTKLLEIAAGSGAWIPFWTAQGVGDYVGIDLSNQALSALRERFPDRRFLQHDLNEPGLPATVGSGYDCVAAIDVLYHVLEDEQFFLVLKEIADSLADNGLLIIHDQFLHGPAIDHGGYIRWRTLKQYEEALTAAGFEILYRRPTFLFMVQTVDFSGRPARFMHTLWDRVTRPLIGRAPRLAGAVGYVVDTVACALLHEGPAMEMMICRRRPRS